MSSGPTPPNTKTTAVRGIDARIRTKTKARAEASFPTTIPRVLTGVAVSRSSVCFSRSRLIAPEVAAGARKTTSSTWRNRRTVKTAWPTDAEAYGLPPPKAACEAADWAERR